MDLNWKCMGVQSARGWPVCLNFLALNKFTKYSDAPLESVGAPGTLV